MKIIDVFICKLRKKLAQAGAGNLISTVWGRGYMMHDPGTAAAAAAATLATPDTLSAAA
jgi:two-component system cell cycle response regulator CtrA